ncbi:MAG: SDR family NAD(P)-dependent oxidoreductase [Candidatus Dormibacteria bacterium]
MRDALGAPQSLLVFGATSDIARAIVWRLCAGNRLRTVVLAARDTAAMAAFGQELRGSGVAQVAEVPFDADDTPAHGPMVHTIFDKHGDIDVCVLAFAVLGDQARTEEDAEAALQVMRTNLLGIVSLTVPLVRRLRAQGHGSLVGLSSVAGERVRRANYTYGASKAGMDAYLQGTADALHGSGVEVIVVRPGFVHTRMTRGIPPAPFSIGPEAVAAAVALALGRGSATIWVPAPVRALMWGLRQLPRPLFRRLPR